MRDDTTKIGLPLRITTPETPHPTLSGLLPFGLKDCAAIDVVCRHVERLTRDALSLLDRMNEHREEAAQAEAAYRRACAEVEELRVFLEAQASEGGKSGG